MPDQPSEKAIKANRVVVIALAAARAAFEAVIDQFPELVVLPEDAEISLSITTPGETND